MKRWKRGIVTARELPAQPNQSLMGGLQCLEMLVAQDRPIGCRELATLLGLETTRVNRLLKTLTALGIAERTAGRQYQPGAGVHVLAAMSLHASTLMRAALRHLPALQRQWPGFSIALGVLWRGRVCYLYYGREGQPMGEVLGYTYLYPAENSSIGRVLLSSHPDDEVKRMLRTRLIPPYDSDRDQALLAELAAVRKRGFAMVEGPSIGVPVGKPPLAGLAAAGPLSPARVPGIRTALKETAAAIAAELQRGGN